MRRFLLLLPVLLVLGLTTPALATHPEQVCPVDVTGTNPSPTEIASLLEAAADKHDVPPQVLKSIAWAEGYDAASDTHWRQYRADGRVVISSDGKCGIGIMQITEAYGHAPLSPRFDRARLASDIAYNIDAGAQILAEKWAAYAAAAPAGVPAPDRSVIENWYHPVRLYNGTAAPRSYPTGVALRVRVPHAYMPGQSYAAQSPGMPWTLPEDVKPDYAYAGWFSVDALGTWYFHDSATQLVLTVPQGGAHAWRERPDRLDYGSLTYGPEDTKAGFSVAGDPAFWRSADGVGLKGRTMWTRTQSPENPPGNVAAWEPSLPCPVAAAQVTVEAYIPTEHADAQAVYRLGPRDQPSSSVTIDQSQHRGQWVRLGQLPACGSSRVSVADPSPGAPGTDLAVDAVRYTIGSASSPTAVSAGTTTPRVTAGNAPQVRGAVTGVGGRPASGVTVQLLSKAYGSASYAAGPTTTTDAAGGYAFTVRPTRQTAYVVRAGSVQSAPVLISVYSRLSIETPAPGSVVNPATFRGALEPAAPGAAVGLAVILDGRFTFVGSAPTDASSRYTITKALPRGTHTFVVYTSARNGTDKGSKSVSLTVR